MAGILCIRISKREQLLAVKVRIVSVYTYYSCAFGSIYIPSNI